MDIKELEQKYNNLEERLSKVEPYLHAQNEWHERVRQLIHESKDKFNQEIEIHSLQEELGD